MKSTWRRVAGWLVGILLGLVPAVSGRAAAPVASPRVLYETGFEKTQGFDETLTLVGQGGWIGEGSGGNGLVTGFLDGPGQQAFVGYGAPTNRNDFLNVWHPINHVPGGTNAPWVRFTVTMSILDSATRTNRDDFRWSVYNAAGNRLFSLAFDNDQLAIRAILDDGVARETGWSFTNDTPYRLEILMNFPSNQWTATLGDVVVVDKLAITTRSSPLDLGDVDAVWAIRAPGSPGDNFMVFDDYRLAAEAPPANPPPRLEALGAVRSGEFLVRVHGTPGVRYVLEAGTDWRTWVPLKTNVPPADGTFDHLDRGGGGFRFYRAVER